jgi:hypothetical protein
MIGHQGSFYRSLILETGLDLLQRTFVNGISEDCE